MDNQQENTGPHLWSMKPITVFVRLATLMIVVSTVTGCKKTGMKADFRDTIVGEWWIDGYEWWATGTYDESGCEKYVFDRKEYVRYFNDHGNDLDCETIEVPGYNWLSPYTDSFSSDYKLVWQDDDLTLRMWQYWTYNGSAFVPGKLVEFNVVSFDTDYMVFYSVLAQRQFTLRRCK